MEIVAQLGPGHWTFRVPQEIQGGVRLRVSGASAGTTAIVRLGEEAAGVDGSAPMSPARPSPFAFSLSRTRITPCYPCTRRDRS